MLAQHEPAIRRFYYRPQRRQTRRRFAISRRANAASPLAGSKLAPGDLLVDSPLAALRDQVWSRLLRFIKPLVDLLHLLGRGRQEGRFGRRQIDYDVGLRRI